MSIGTISDVLTRISGIEQQLQSLQSGSLLDSQLGVGSGSSTSSSGSSTSSADSSSSSDFANQLAAAQDGSTGTTSDDADAADATAGTSDSTLDSLDSSALDSSALGSTSQGTTSLDSSALGSSASTSSLLGADTLSSLTGASSSGVSLSPSASSQLTSGQQQFASTLSAETGLNPNVVSSWLLAEESGGAAQSREAAGNNDWLNIGYTGSGTYGSTDSVWSDPTTAANATAGWLKGQDSIPGYGTASSGVQSILFSVGQTPAAQIQAIQSSGWSSGGYPSLDTLYNQVATA
jgi:hypothetical protein